MLEEDLKNIFTQELSMELKLEFFNMNRLFHGDLARMRSFNKEYKDFLILPVSLAELPWTHKYTLIEEEMDGEENV